MQGEDFGVEPDNAPTPIVIVGAGVFLHDILSLLAKCPEFQIAGILDPALHLKGQKVNNVPILGWLGDIPDDIRSAVIGTPSTPDAFDREAVFHLLLKRGMSLPILHDKTSRIAQDVMLRRATVIINASTIDEGATIGENCIIGNGAHIGRAAELADHTVVLPGETVLHNGGKQKQLVQPRSLGAALASDKEHIQEIIRRINQTGIEIMLITDDSGALAGTVTDGDIRRGILAGVNLNQSVNAIMNRAPISTPLGTSYQQMIDIMRQNSIRHLPVLDNARRPVRLEIMDDLMINLRNHGAVVMAGGLGQRLRPLTETVPKPLLPVNGQPILDHILSGLRDSGLHDVVISVNYLADTIRKHVGNGHKHNVNVAYLSEIKRMGTAGALSLLRPRPKRPFLVMNGDLMTDMNFAKLMEFHITNSYSVVMCVRKQEVHVPYGVVNIEKGRVTGIREKPTYEHFINAGIYVVDPSCLELVPEGKPFDMPDLINAILATNGKVGAFPIIEYWRDIGTPADLLAAGEDQRRMKIESDNAEGRTAQLAEAMI